MKHETVVKPKNPTHSEPAPPRDSFLNSYVSPPPVAVGTALSQDEVDLYKKARDAMWPIARIATYDDFAKWLFTTIAVIGTLGAALSGTTFKVMRPAGAVVFGVSALLASIALAASVLSRASDFPTNTNWMSPEAVSNASQLMRQKRSLVKLAGVCFAISLLCASAAPMVSLFSIPSRQGNITVSSGKDGIHIGVVLVSKDDNAGELTIIGIQGKTESVFSYQKANSDDSGTIKLDGSAPLLGSTFTGLRIILSCDRTGGKHQEATFPIVQGTIAATSEQLHNALSSGACINGS